MMALPLVSFIAFNRLGLTINSLNSILSSTDDFELHIVDSNSRDDTWKYLESVEDKRIRSRIKLPVNSGPIFALNFNLVKRRKEQFFFTVDSDVVIKTKDWISRFMKVFDTFPQVGVLGMMRGNPYPQLYPPVLVKQKGDVSYLELRDGKVDVMLDFVHGCCMGLRPELIDQIGYFSEENGYGDAELSPRVNNYTSYRVGFMTDVNFKPIIDIDMTQTMPCEVCLYKDKCTLDRTQETCFTIHKKNHKNESFVTNVKEKYLKTFKELEEGKRTAYCASILDPASSMNHLYHKDWAMENFSYYIENSNMDV